MFDNEYSWEMTDTSGTSSNNDSGNDSSDDNDDDDIVG